MEVPERLDGGRLAWMVGLSRCLLGGGGGWTSAWMEGRMGWRAPGWMEGVWGWLEGAWVEGVCIEGALARGLGWRGAWLDGGHLAGWRLDGGA